jgi:hypothetical protein
MGKRKRRKKKITKEQIIKWRMKAIDKKALRDVKFSVVPNTTYWNRGK